MSLSQEQKIQLLNHCTQHMTLSAMSLGSSGSKAAKGGNLAFIEVYFDDQLLFRRHAFSNSSALGASLKNDFSPSVGQKQLGTFGIPYGMQHGNHTEPKLVQNFKDEMGMNFRPFNRIVLASQLNCCGSCVKYSVNEMSGLAGLLSLDGATDVQFIVVEVNSGRVREGHEVS